MRTHMTITEEDIHAYVDGRLDLERRRQVEQVLAVDPEARAKVTAYQNQNKLLRRLFSPVKSSGSNSSNNPDGEG